MTKFPKTLALFSAILILVLGCAPGQDEAQLALWETVETQGEPTARHEAAFVAHRGKLYLIGGRRMNPTDIYDPATNAWTKGATPPLELHHFQAVSIDETIYIVGAMTGGWPNETPVDRVIAYHPEKDQFEFLHEIPADRRRGAAGVAVYENEIYIAGGIVNGHMDGTVPWLDRYDPATGEWTALPDSPDLRDHFQAAVIDGHLYAFSGRRSLQRTNSSFELTTAHGNIFDINTGQWLPVTEAMEIPTPRAGNMAIGWDRTLIIGGGESGSQVPAHSEVEAFDLRTRRWSKWPALNQGRHGSGFGIVDDYLYTVSGSGNRGGEPELVTLERIALSKAAPAPLLAPASDERIVHQWHTLTLPFTGPMTSEDATPNPFTDYRLTVTFTHAETQYTVRGFYAGDGNAAETGATDGSQWHVRFTPDHPGRWDYTASMREGPMIALDASADSGTPVEITNSAGSFVVTPSPRDGVDFRAHGRLIADGQYFRFRDSGEPWLKGGANSPENLLGYFGFDGTFRIEEAARDGEAATGGKLHDFAPHEQDWRLGDPLWGDGKGKGLIGSMNYLADQGMNTAYFLTMNILGDGKDVWPYRTPTELDRFDVSKLDQWEVLFAHMQARGILLHVVTQETENELMLDGGDTGPMRQLYYLELIARFAHHPALVWNLGEENGPVHWRPEGQNTEQRMAMAKFLKENDPYKHPVFLHTHAEIEDKDTILTPLLGFEYLDGLSFQVSERTVINAEVQKWLALSAAAGKPWMITMDEVGMWHTGAKTDADDPTHDSLRRHALWGAFLGGSAGVEWYFGAHQPGNDLTSEDWRMREELWRQTRHALTFFDTYIPYTDMVPLDLGDNAAITYGMGNREIAVLYIEDAEEGITFNLSGDQPFTVAWFDPIEGGPLQQGSVAEIEAGQFVDIGTPPSVGRDWVALLRLSASVTADAE